MKDTATAGIFRSAAIIEPAARKNAQAGRSARWGDHLGWDFLWKNE